MRIATLIDPESGRLSLAFAEVDGRVTTVADAMAETGLDLDPAALDPDSVTWLGEPTMDGLRRIDESRDPALSQSVEALGCRLAAPVMRPGKIVAVGRNYMDHVREGQEIWAKRGRKVEIPEYPSAFAKFASSLTGPYDAVAVPNGIDDLDYEIELAVVIGKPALNVSEEEALDHVVGYCICNDLAARGIQRREMEQQIGITLAKNFPRFAPMGPWLTTSDAIGDPQSLDLVLDVDGDVRQQASTADMIFPVRKLISYFSQVGLETGDMLITGTPSGVALAREEPGRFYLRAGQVVTARIEGLGEIRNRIE